MAVLLRGAADGEELVEYALLVAFIGLACVRPAFDRSVARQPPIRPTTTGVQDLWVPPGAPERGGTVNP